MSKISMLLLALLATIAPLLASSATQAQSSGSKKADLRTLGERTTAPVAKPARRGGMKACPEYGAGFYRLDGSDTCVRVSGGIASDVGVSRIGR